ncbi:AHH domain-containing protein [Vibrio sp. H11]|uniref:AHH domain-containing protein n=1 Tax=Vibrio sp. H11 TaxID=2565928 RepID=UPI0010A66329|nr:AHH domain-containing protein [Vibrio sp. H11]
MSQGKQTELLSSAQAAKQNFQTDNVIDGGCVECGCEVFVHYHYDDGQPISDASFVLTDSNQAEITGKTDANGMFKVQNMGCGAYDLMLGEGSDEFEPQPKLQNNPVLQDNPEYAVLAGEYFALFTLLRKEGCLVYDADDSSDEHVDVDRDTWFVPDEYESAYDRFWELSEQINNGPISLRQAVNKMHSSLAGELAGRAQDNSAILLFCQIALGFVPVVGQALDLYDLGDWGWRTYEGDNLDNWHWGEGALVAIGFVPGLGDAAKKTGMAIIDALKKSDSRAIQLAIKMIRSLSNGNIVQYLSGIASTLKECGAKAIQLLEDIIAGLERLVSQSNSWIIRLAKDAFLGLINAMDTLAKKVDAMVDWLITQVNEFISKVVTRVSGTPARKNTLRDAQPMNAGTAKPAQRLEPEQKSGSHEQSANDTQSRDAKQNTNCTNECGTEPIDLNTGKMFEQRTDFSVDGLLALELTRYYQSTGERASGILGSLWRTNWDIALEIQDEQVEFVDYDHSRALFVLPADQQERTRSIRKPGWTLQRDGFDLTLTHVSGMQYRFGHAEGNALKLSALGDAFGHQIEFLYDRDILKAVVLPDGRYIKVKSQRRRVDALVLFSSQDEMLETLATYQYDRKGWLTAVRAAPGRNFDYHYDDKGYLTRWNDLAHTWVEHDFDEQGRAIATRCSGDFWWDKVRYDDERHITYHRDAFGGVIQYHLDERNRAVKVVAADGAETLQEWQGELLSAIVNPNGERTEYTHDELGNLTSVTLPSGIAHQYQYNESGQLTAYINPLGASWLLDYHSAGTLQSVTDPDGHQWEYEYNEHGLRTLSRGPDGLAVHYDYDDIGRLIGLRPEMGEAVTFTYDALGRLSARTIGGQTRRWRYEDTKRMPAQVVYEDGTHASFQYDIEGNLTKVTDAMGNASAFSYGAFDKLLTATDPMGAVTQYHYNPMAEFAGVTNSQGHQWRYEFDECGRIHTERHYDGRTESYRYDSAGRLVEHIKPNQHALTYRYNADGQLVENHSLNPLGEQTGRTWYEYDDAGRLISAENGDIDVVMEYSPGGQLLQECLGGVALTHQYDKAGYRQQLSGTHTLRQYQWQQGQLAGLQVGDHQALNFAYNPMGLEQQRLNGQGFHLHHDWDDRGRLQAQRLGSKTLTGMPDALREYHYDKLDRLVGIDDSHWGSERFELNRNGQITSRTHTPQKGSQYQFVTLFGYDSELNLNETASATHYTDTVVPISQAALNKAARQYDNAGRVVQVGRFTYHYDECGRAIQKIERKDGFRPQATNFSWDEHDRLIRIELPNGERWRYRYDAFGRRVAKECERGAQASQQVHYLYDGAQVIQQTLKTANGEALQSTEYIYEPGSFRPVAQVNTHHQLQTEKLHYVVTDHAGTPRELCSENGDIVWRGEQGLWQGHHQTLQSNIKQLFEDAANDPVQCDLRYQGQIEDKESGLYYNLNRYYDADSGQYLSSDPIGMLGGLRPQAYVHNPMEWVDPLGLTGCSTKLGKNMMESMGLPRSTKWAGYQAHHVIPKQLNDHPILKKIEYDIDAPENGIFLRKADDMSSAMARHQGNHNGYTKAIKNALDKIDCNRSVEDIKRQVANIQSVAKQEMQNGLPIRSKDLSRNGGEEGNQVALKLWNNVLGN